MLLQILVTAETRKQPEGFKGVYTELNRIIAAAESDPRKFSGFEKHWHPQRVGPASALQRLHTAACCALRAMAESGRRSGTFTGCLRSAACRLQPPAVTHTHRRTR